MRILVLGFALLCGSSFAQEEHGHHGSATSHAAAAAANRFGSVRFETSCQPALAEDFNKAVAILHSFEYDEARKAFEQIGKKDPACAMPEWGQAMTYFHGLWGEFDPVHGRQRIAEAKRIAAENPQTTEREKGYINALAEMYSEDAIAAARPMGDSATGTSYSIPSPLAEQRYTQKMAELHRTFPSDREATIFYALALDISARNEGKAHAHEHECNALLTPLFAELPNHPGIAHYIIHCNDNPEMASEGLDAARKYAQIAPASAHATHMPSHIFAQLGLWSEMVASNVTSVRAAEADKDASPCEKVGNTLHSLSFLVVGLAEEGRLTEARHQLENASRLRAGITGAEACPDKSNDVLALYILETGDWTRGRELQPQGDPRPIFRAIFWTAVGVAAANTSDDARAAKAEQALMTLRTASAKGSNASADNRMDAFRLMVSAARAEAAGHTADAIRNLRTAADLQDRLDGNYTIMKPAREMLADSLLKNGDFSQALREYKSVLQDDRNRFDSVYGAASAAYAMGDRETARAFYKQLLSFASGSEREGVEIARARVLETKAGMERQDQPRP